MYCTHIIDIVVVLDYSRKADNAVVKRNNIVIEVPKKFLKRAECTDLQNYSMKLSQHSDTSYSHWGQHKHKGLVRNLFICIIFNYLF
jgi:hypothetical protein